ncbi:MAG TPA: peroxiredoxin [Verrucomicrobiota bacterium]|nr:peroxiredoxin [Verrucomicrobiales bacterium]HRI16710.1 peroxiredoxin [Verrucomicrobiota bacterium]
MKPLCLLLAILAATTSLTAFAAETPKVGDQPPLIEAKDQDGATWKLADQINKQLILLYFYPKDDTPGCTKEACGLRDEMGSLKKDGVIVVGVSRDDAESHKKFRAKYNLNFPLLVDTDGKLTEAFAVAMEGKPMARRVSFLIGKNGKILHVTDNRDAQVHLDEMKAAIAKAK